MKIYHFSQNLSTNYALEIDTPTVCTWLRVTMQIISQLQEAINPLIQQPLSGCT